VEGLFPRGATQLKLAICGGALLVALHLLAEYGLYVMIRFDTFTTAIYDQFQSTFSGPAANMLAGVLALCCLAILVLEGVTRGKARYARIGAGAAREQKRWPLKPAAAALGQLFFMVLIVLALGVPLAVLCRWIWLGGVENWMSADLWHSLRQTLMLGVGGALLTTTCVIPIAWLGIRYPHRIFRMLEGCIYITSSLPGIVTALALVTVTIHYARPIYQTEITLFLAYLLMFMPRALINLRAGMRRRRLSWKTWRAALAARPRRRSGASRCGWPRRVRGGGGRAGVPRRQQRVDRHAVTLSAGHAHALYRILGADQRN
jgi:iron(III) transport system permease protein